MTIDHVVRAAVQGSLDSPLVDAACAELGTTPIELLDVCSREVARLYLAGELNWQDGDSAMNHIYAYAYVFSDTCLSKYARGVFTAFDEAEYVHEGDPPDFDHELRTRALLREFEEEADD